MVFVSGLTGSSTTALSGPNAEVSFALLFSTIYHYSFFYALQSCFAFSAVSFPTAIHFGFLRV